MEQQSEKPIADITINYADGTRTTMEFYALVGYGENTWHNVLSTPSSREQKIKMNNFVVEMSNKLIESVGM